MQDESRTLYFQAKSEKHVTTYSSLLYENVLIHHLLELQPTKIRMRQFVVAFVFQEMMVNETA
jgi:hypothetical protein